MSSIAGNPDLVEQPIVRGRNAQTGPYIIRSWKGTEDACNAGLDELTGFDNAEVTGGDNAVYTLSARFAGVDPVEPQNEVPVHEERLHFNRVTKSIYNHPNYADITPATMALIRQAVDNRQTVPASLVGAALELYELAVAGVESFTIDVPVVVVTDTASAGFLWTIGFSNVGKIFSTDGMIADADLNSGWADNLPQDNAASGFIAGWKKGPPEISTVGGNRSQLVQEYEYDAAWVEALYDFVA